MNKNFLIGIAIIAFGILAVLGYLSRMGNSSEKMGASVEKAMMSDEKASPEAMAGKGSAESDGVMMEKDVDAAMDADGMRTAGGQYVPYEESKLAFAKEGKVVLFFNASWCPQCRAIDRDIKASLADIPKNLLILSVDYDSMTELKKRYTVLTQHTFVQIDANGTELGKWVGGETLEEVVKNVK